MPIPQQNTLTSGIWARICGPVQRTCAFQFMSFAYWFGFTTSSPLSALIFSALKMPPRGSIGSGWDGPPKRVMLRPKNLISCSFVQEVLLLRNALVSVMP